MKKQNIRALIFCCLIINPLIISSAKAQCGEALNLGKDTSICAEYSILLDAGSNRMEYLWQDGSTNSTIEASEGGQYWCEVKCVGDNLIINGDFEQGDRAFNSDYMGSSKNLVPEGRFCITNDPGSTHGAFKHCSNHTANGKMQMVVNGSPRPNTNVWRQTIKVQPHTNYRFSTWATSVLKGNPALLQFSINGRTIGAKFSVGIATCDWKQFYQVWNSGEATTAQISILNQTLSAGGNDFTIDDIYFAPVLISRDTINIQKSTPPISALTNDTTLCEGGKLQLLASTQICETTWSTGETSSTIEANKEGVYSIQLKDSLGCITNDSISVSIHEYPSIDLGPDISICDNNPLTLKLADEKFSYRWQNQSTQNTITISEAGRYWVEGNNHGCRNSDTINIKIKPSPIFTIGNDTTLKKRVRFIISPTIEGQYLWSNGATSKNYLSRIQEKVMLTVTSENQCSNTEEIMISRLKVILPTMPNNKKILRKIKEPTVIGYTQHWDSKKNKWIQKEIVEPLAYSDSALIK